MNLSSSSLPLQRLQTSPVSPEKYAVTVTVNSPETKPSSVFLLLTEFKKLKTWVTASPA